MLRRLQVDGCAYYHLQAILQYFAALLLTYRKPRLSPRHNKSPGKYLYTIRIYKIWYRLSNRQINAHYLVAMLRTLNLI